MHASPSPLSNAMYWGARGTLRQIYRVWPLSDRGIRSLAVMEKISARLPRPQRVRFDPAELGDVPVEIVTPTEPDPGPLERTAVLYLHGGGFLFCGTATHRRICARFAVNTGAPVYSVRYRQLPEFGPGTSVADAYAAYLGLVDELPDDSRIVIAGDSAGGFLATKVCELAAMDGMRKPDAYVAYSPHLDLDAELSDGEWATRDAYQPASTVRRAHRLWDRGPIALRGSRSLQNCDPACLPPAFITIAEDELLAPPALALAQRLRAAGQIVETHAWRRGVHAFPVLDALTAESREASDLTVDFLRRVLRD